MTKTSMVSIRIHCSTTLDVKSFMWHTFLSISIWEFSQIPTPLDFPLQLSSGSIVVLLSSTGLLRIRECFLFL